MFYMISICGINYILMHNSQFIRSISCVSSIARNTTNNSNKLRVVYEYIIL